MLNQAAGGQRWMMTTEAHSQLLDELAQLRREIVTLAGQGLEEGIARMPIAHASRRLQTLGSVIDDAEIAETGCVAIGRRVEARDADGNLIHCSIVFPGDGDPATGLVSADSPLGAALLGRRPGDTVTVAAPAGAWPVTVVRVT